MNQGIHTADLLQWLLGPVRRVSARTVTALHRSRSRTRSSRCWSSTAAPSATLEATTAAFPATGAALELTGTEGTVVVEHDRLVAADLRRPGRRSVGRGAGDQNASASSPVVSDARGPSAPVRGFLRRHSPGPRAALQRPRGAAQRRARPRDLRRRPDRGRWVVSVSVSALIRIDLSPPTSSTCRRRRGSSAARSARAAPATNGTCGPRAA